MIELLEKKNGNVTDIEQAVFNKISTNNSNGYVDGFMNSFKITKASSNTISIDKGMLSVQGYRLVNRALEIETIDYVAQTPTPFHTILKLNIFASSENNSFEIISRPKQALKQDNIYLTGTGTYEVELCSYTMTAAGIEDFKVTIYKIKVNDFTLQEVKNLINSVSLAPSNEFDQGTFNKPTTTPKVFKAEHNGHLIVCITASRYNYDVFQWKYGNSPDWFEQILPEESNRGVSTITVIIPMRKGQTVLYQMKFHDAERGSYEFRLSQEV